MWLLTPVTSLCQPAAHAEDEDAGGTRDRRTHHASPFRALLAPREATG